jgi:poly(A) polymerase
VEPIILERSDHPISRRDIDPNVLKVLYRLINAGYTAYLVGGGVRDLMMGRRPKDFDIATSAHPHQVRELFRNSRLIGRRFRLVHVFFGPQNIEVSTFRRRSEEIIDPDDPFIRHDNTFGSPEEDAFRRDFTVNALFYDPSTFRVIDYVDGVTDLKDRVIRTVGDPELRMREDPVRMIRAVRFAIKLDFAIESETRGAMERHRSDLTKASLPRLIEETYRTLMIPGAERALVLLEQIGILDLLVPFVSEHLRTTPLEVSAPVLGLAALSTALCEGREFTRPQVLTALFAGYHLSRADMRADDRLVLVGALRARGFSRVDTEQMRLLLEAITHLARRSRNLRRLTRRPYFSDAQMLYELLAPALGFNSSITETSSERPLSPADGGRRRRRRRSRGRRRKTAIGGKETASGASLGANAAADSDPAD